MSAQLAHDSDIKSMTADLNELRIQKDNLKAEILDLRLKIRVRTRCSLVLLVNVLKNKNGPVPDPLFKSIFGKE